MLVLLGNTGSGKTTLAKELTARQPERVRISSGDIARELAERDSAVRIALQSGNLAPEIEMRSEVRARIRTAESLQQIWILDGFPRSLEQLILLQQWTGRLPIFVHVDISPWTAIERLTDRDRHDDNPDAIARRLRDFQQNVQPVLDVLESGEILETVNGEWDTKRQADLIERIMHEFS